MRFRSPFLLGIVVLGLAACTATPPTDQGSTSSTAEKSDTVMHGEMDSDGVMMKDGAMMVIKGGQSSKMEADMTMKDGTTVMMDGRVLKPDGSMMKMEEGMMMDMDGDLYMKKGDSMMKGTEAMEAQDASDGTH